MTAQEIKAEIQKELNTLPESVLDEILFYLKSMKGRSGSEIQRSQNLRKILQEDRELLERLAR